MYVNVDPAAGTATLEDAEVFTAFHVCAPDGLPVADVVAALGELGKACDADEHVWVSATGVRALAAGSVGPDWDTGFEGMLGYARSKGWTDESGEWVQAHIERT
ncbi:MAG: hypothetical protein KDB21_08135 [Acidimicrobiales bacterium]|nr:hypothetical protein [Acidimicrobiales bacterium]